MHILGMVWISWGMRCQIFHIPLREDSQAAVVYIALWFRGGVLLDEAWKWDQLLSMVVAAFPYIKTMASLGLILLTRKIHICVY